MHHNSTWLTIDPQGIKGNMAFEVAKFDFVHATEIKLKSDDDITKLYRTRITELADLLKIDAQQWTQWTFTRLILCATWCIEDNMDPTETIAVAEHIYPLFTTKDKRQS